MPDWDLHIADRRAPFRAADPDIRRIAADLRRDIAAATPRRTGRLAAGWESIRIRDAHYHVRNPVPYARFVEHGTRRRPARPAAGRVLAAYRVRWGR